MMVGDRCVLVVEDHRELRDVLVEALTDHGYRAVGHGRATDVCTLAERLRADLVVLDLRLDGESDAGWRVLDALRRDPATQAIPVLICSGIVDDLERAAGVPAADVRVLPKPFELHALLAAVADLLRERRRAVRPTLRTGSSLPHHSARRR